MPDNKQDINFVETLRLKTEEADMQHYLKSTMNGYTKKSVHEYLTILRKQQQSMSDTFSNNQQVLFEEKEGLKKDNEALKSRLSQLESEYRALSDVQKDYKPEIYEDTPADTAVPDLEIKALKEELSLFVSENSQLVETIAQNEGAIKKLSEETEELQNRNQEQAKKLEAAEAESLAQKRETETHLAQKESVISDLTKRLQQSGEERLALSDRLRKEAEDHKSEKLEMEARLAQYEAAAEDYSKKIGAAEREKHELLEMLKEERRKFGDEKHRLESRITKQESIARDAAFQLEHSEREKEALKEKFRAELLEIRKLQETISRLSATIKQQEGELRQLNARVSDDRFTELNEKVGDLSLQLSNQFGVLAKYDRENELKAQIIRTMSQEKDTLKQSVSHLSRQIEEANNQNKKLIMANNLLSDQLESEYKKYIALLQDGSCGATDDFTETKDPAGRVPDIMMLELHNNSTNSEKITKVYHDAYRVGSDRRTISKEDITKCSEQSSHIIARSVSCRVSK